MKRNKAPIYKRALVILSDAKDLWFLSSLAGRVQRCFALLNMTAWNWRRGVVLQASLDVGI